MQPQSSQQPSTELTSDSSAVPTAPIKDPAVELIRQKVAAIYADEPDATAEVAEVTHIAPQQLSVHQKYMADLSSSGRSIADIQSAWHAYYAALPEADKHVVWQEFYAASNASSQPVVVPSSASVEGHSNPQADTPMQTSTSEPAVVGSMIPSDLPTPAAEPIIHHRTVLPVGHTRRRALGRHSRVGADNLSRTASKLKQRLTGESVGDIKARILDTARTTSDTSKKLQTKHHLQSLAFGLASGGVVLVIFLFGFFNQVVIAPLIQPSRKINDTPVIVSTASANVGSDPKVLIPKINVEIPVDYSQTTTDESQIELALDKGIVHYPITSKPGELGNAAFFGHSSNNIFNPGKYKFAFVLLHNLVEGDVFYLTRDGKTYAYKVFSKRIVPPTEVSVLDPVAGHPATATLITCDPPGTSINRLIVVGDQISPSVDSNSQPATQTATTTGQTTTASANLPGNGPTLWSRIWNSVF